MPTVPRINITEIQRNQLFHLNLARNDTYKNPQFVVSLPQQDNRLMTDSYKIIASSSRRGIITQLKGAIQLALIPGPTSIQGVDGRSGINWFNRQTQSASHYNSHIKSDRVIGIAIKLADNQWLEFPFEDGPIVFQDMLPEVHPHGQSYGSPGYALAQSTYRNNVRTNKQRLNKISTLCRKAADVVIEQLEALGVIRIQTYLDYVSGVIPVQVALSDGSEPEDDEYNAATNDH